jgi:serine palmitoyltransferase
MDLRDASDQLQHLLSLASTQLSRVPGSAIVVRYIRSSHQNDPIRTVVEVLLFLFFVRYLLAPKYSTQRKGFVELTEQEIDELVDEWTPEPLVAPLTPLEQADLERRPVIVGPTGPKVKLANGKTVTNLASYNFYNLVGSEFLKEKAIQTLRTYGVGPCGPPGFYGTQDVHLKTEEDVAKFLGVEAAIVYAQAFSTISSMIPAFAKRGDIIVADSGVNYAIRKGLQISRSIVHWYEHNDLADLERVLQKVTKENARKPLTRRFIVTEGLFELTGDLVDLPKLVELKTKYKLRLVLDESWSFGVLGRNGRGVTESQNVDATQVDMIVGSLSAAICAGGGFCAGSREVVEHQRLSGMSYVFSAALPAMLSTNASETLNIFQDSPELFSTLRENVKAMWTQLDPRSEWVECSSDMENPIMILRLKKAVLEARGLSADEQDRLFVDIVEEVRFYKNLHLPMGDFPFKGLACGNFKCIALLTFQNRLKTMASSSRV